jgi:hypothetical protein
MQILPGAPEEDTTIVPPNLPPDSGNAPPPR